MRVGGELSLEEPLSGWLARALMPLEGSPGGLSRDEFPPSSDRLPRVGCRAAGAGLPPRSLAGALGITAQSVAASMTAIWMLLARAGRVTESPGQRVLTTVSLAGMVRLWGETRQPRCRAVSMASCLR